MQAQVGLWSVLAFRNGNFWVPGENDKMTLSGLQYIKQLLHCLCIGKQTLKSKILIMIVSISLTVTTFVV